MPTSRVRLGAIALVALALAPSGAAAQTGEAYMRAMELEQAEKYQEAAGAYREALRANPGSVPVVLGLERVYAQIGLTDSIVPVLEATDLVVSWLMPMSEHACDYGALLPQVRALREQVDWSRVAAVTADSPYAATFITLLERLGVLESPVEPKGDPAWP